MSNVLLRVEDSGHLDNVSLGDGFQTFRRNVVSSKRRESSS